MVGFSTSLGWHDDLNYEYYKYFNDADKEVRAGSTFAFLGMMMNWHGKSCCAFLPDTGEEFKDCPNQFKPFLEEFLKNSNSMKKEFPEMYHLIVQALYDLDNENGFEETFPHIDRGLFTKMRGKLFSDDMINMLMNPRDYEGVLKEVGLGSRYF